MNRRDHIGELFNKLTFGSPPKLSSYGSTYGFGYEHKTDVKDHDFQYHFKNDKVKVYVETMLKQGGHFRK